MFVSVFVSVFTTVAVTDCAGTRHLRTAHRRILRLSGGRLRCADQRIRQDRQHASVQLPQHGPGQSIVRTRQRSTARRLVNPVPGMSSRLSVALGGVRTCPDAGQDSSHNLTKTGLARLRTIDCGRMRSPRRRVGAFRHKRSSRAPSGGVQPKHAPAPTIWECLPLPPPGWPGC
jgi:hypothetical protein